MMTIMTLIAVLARRDAALAATVTQAPSDHRRTPLRTRADSLAPAPGRRRARRRPTTGCAATTQPDASCTGITGACGRTYTVRQADEGHTLRVAADGHRVGRQGGLGDSDPTAVVARSPMSIPTPATSDTCIQVTPTGPGQGHVHLGHPDRRRVRADPGHDALVHQAVPRDPHRRPLQGHAHHAHARHGQDAEGHAHPDPLQRARLRVQAQGGGREARSASARCGARTARRRRSRSA